MSCTRSWEVQAVDEGRLGASDIAAFERHTRACSSCLEEVTALRELRALARQASAPPPGALELRRLRGRVLRDAMSATSPHRPRAAIAAVLFAVTAAVTVVVAQATRPVATKARASMGTSPAESFAAVVTPAAKAEWMQGREGRVERVALRDGELSLSVRKQAPDERFLVAVPDGEIEVRGTEFDVAVHGGQTVGVHVESGVVVVRVHGESVLRAGESWPLPVTADGTATPVTPPTPALRVAATPGAGAPAAAASSSGRGLPPTLATPPRTENGGRPADDAPGSSTDRELSEYQRAIDAYRLGRFDQAAEALHAFVIAHPASPLVDDASFIEAASSASAGHAEAAAQLAERHMLRFPESFHKKDAAILVARFRRDHDDCTGARRALAPWLVQVQPDPGVASALGKCAREP